MAGNIVLKICSILNILAGLIAFVVQVVIINNYADNTYAKVGSGIFGGIIFVTTGIFVLIAGFKENRNTLIHSFGLSMAIVSLIMSLVLIGISSKVIHEITKFESIEIGEVLNSPFQNPEMSSIFMNFINIEKSFPQFFRSSVNIPVCDIFANDFCSARTTLEAVLLCTGIESFIVNVVALFYIFRKFPRN